MDFRRRVTARNGWHEVLIFLILLGLCPVVAFIEPGTIGSARRNALVLIGLEQRLGLHDEQRWHQWLLELEMLHSIVDTLYFAAHLSAVIGVLFWAWHRRPCLFVQLRNLFAITQLCVVLGYLALPVTPPHLLAGPDAGPETMFHHLQYVHAAFPSGHMAFAVVAGIGVRALWPSSRWAAVAAFAYPIFVAWMVVATGNHYWLDVAAGAVVPFALGPRQLVAGARPGRSRVTDATHRQLS